MKTLHIFVTMAILALVGSANGQTLTNLYSFSGSDGASPYAPLVQGTDGNFYGTTYYGGSGTNCSDGCGTIFQITPSGTLTTLYSFSGSDGAHPAAELIQGGDGNFYGTTYAGGHGNGTVFRVTTTGSLTNLCVFTVFDGAGSRAGLVQASDGNFYGTTYYGGTNACGTIFRITPSGSFTNLHFFNGVDGRNPWAWLVQDSDSNFYGTTYYGGYTNLNSGQGYGTVFRITSSGTLTTLYSFSNTNYGFASGDGRFPVSGLVQGSDGNLYGTTSEGGGDYEGLGTIFRIAPSGTLTTIAAFELDSPIFAPQAQGSDGNFYGANSHAVFWISPAGMTMTVHGLAGYPLGGPVQGSDGNFYGTTEYGGTYGSGTVYKLSVPLNPPANQISSFQPAGTNVVVTVPSVAGETYQLQFATDLVAGNWSNVVGVCVSNSIGAALTVTNFGGATGPQGFYRFAITP